MTYTARELQLFLSVEFECNCPAYPNIKSASCPLHHESPPGASSVEEAKETVGLVRVEIQQEEAISRKPARVIVYQDEKPVAEVIAEVKLKQGADGDFYHCVTLKRV